MFIPLTSSYLSLFVHYVMQFLLSAGADPWAATIDGQLPIDIAWDVKIKTILDVEMKKQKDTNDFLDGGLEF